MKNYWIEQKIDEFMIEKAPKQSKAGFPSDDTLALQQMASGEFNLDIYPSCQYVQNEKPPIVFCEQFGSTVYQLQYSPMLAGTTTGTIYFDNIPCFVFVVQTNGEFKFTRIQIKDIEICEKVQVYPSELNLTTGKLRLNWDNKGYGYTRPELIVSYEYNLECQ